MKNIINKILMICLVLFMSSCYYDAYPEEDTTPPSDDISYQADIMPLWVQCVGCHNGNEPPDLRDENSYNSLLNGYVVAGDPDASILYNSLLGNGVSQMPPGTKWPESKISLVKAWIEQGAKNN